MGLERVARQFQPEQQPDGTGGNLGRDRQAAGGGFIDGVHRLAPASRRLVGLGYGKRDRAFGILGNPQHHRQIFVDGALVEHELQYAAADAVHRCRNRSQFIFARFQRRRVVAGRSAVIEGARGRKAQCA